MRVIVAIFFAACVAHEALALSSGAPTIACETMTPGHGPEPQPLPAPYTVTATAIDANRYQITIEADSGTTFKGFLVQARSDLTDSAIGTFDTSELSQSIDCYTTPMSASTHVSSDLKTSVSVIWNSPGTGEAFSFVASVVENYSTFWVKIPATLA